MRACSALREQSAAEVDESDEDDAFEDVDPNDLIDRELQRVRAEAKLHGQTLARWARRFFKKYT